MISLSRKIVAAYQTKKLLEWLRGVLREEPLDWDEIREHLPSPEVDRKLHEVYKEYVVQYLNNRVKHQTGEFLLYLKSDDFRSFLSKHYADVPEIQIAKESFSIKNEILNIDFHMLIKYETAYDLGEATERRLTALLEEKYKKFLSEIDFWLSQGLKFIVSSKEEYSPQEYSEHSDEPILVHQSFYEIFHIKLSPKKLNYPV